MLNQINISKKYIMTSFILNYNEHEINNNRFIDSNISLTNMIF